MARLVVTADGRYLVAGESGAICKPVIRVYDLKRDKSFTLGSHKHMGMITALAPTPDGSGVLAGEINLTNMPAGFDLHGVLRLFDLNERGQSVVSDARVALNGGDDGSLRLWDLDRGELIREFEAHPGDAPACALTADSSVGISGGEDGKVRVWGFDWEYRFPDAGDFDRAAEPYLEALSTRRARLPRKGRWNEADIDWLHARLGECGYDWIRREAVHATLLQVHR